MHLDFSRLQQDPLPCGRSETDDWWISVVVDVDGQQA